MKWFRRTPNVPPAPAPAAVTAPVVPRPEIPRYPPFLQGLPLYATEEVRETQQELVLKLRYAVGCTPEQYEAWVVPVVDRYTAYVHLLPASESHHHRGAGGLLHHGLEVAFLAGQASGGKVFAMDREPKVRRIHEPLWRLAATLAGLCHDIGKPLSDLSVTDRDGTCTWSPMQETLAVWAARHGIDSYYLHWRDRQHNRHESAGMMMLERMLGPATIALFYDHDAAIMNALIDAVGGQKETATLTQLVANADRASVERDLQTNRIDPQAHSLGVPIERYLIDAMCRLVRDGTWRINTPGARLWMLAEGLHVVWPQGGDEIVNLLAADRVPGIPRHPDTLADILIERGAAVAPTQGDGVRRYWRLAPALLASAGKPVTLTLLRLSAPGLVLSGPVPEVAAVYREVTVGAVVPRQGQGQRVPDGRPGGNAPAVADADGALGDAPTGEGTASGWSSLVGAEQLGAATGSAQRGWAGTQAPPQHLARGRGDPAASDPRAPPATVPVGQSAPAVAQSMLAAVRPPDPGAAARQVARTWFQAPERGAGGRLLLALAEAIGTGERVAAQLLYVPAAQVWVRMPHGLEGFGAAPEAQVAVLWEAGLLAINVLQPYVQIRELDGVRGVALKSPASDYFMALLPAAVLASCAVAGTPAGVPAAVVVAAAPQAGGPAPSPPVSLRSPWSTGVPARAAARASAPSPSVVADEVLARVRAEHLGAVGDAPGEGAVIQLTRAELADVAQRAGLAPQSLRRVLTQRPGCGMTADGGVAIAIDP